MGKWNKAPPEVSEEFMLNQQRRKQMIVQATRRRRQKQKKLLQQAQICRKSEEQALTRHKQEKKDAYIKYLRNNMHDKYQEMKRNQKANQPQVRSKSKWKKDSTESDSQMKNQNNLESLNLQVNIQNKRKSIQNRTYNKEGGPVIKNQASSDKQMPKAPNPSQWNKQKIKQKQKTAQQLPKQTQKRRMLQNQFQNLWKQDHEQEQNKQIQYQLSVDESMLDDMIGSKLLDSLDLDFGTVTRGKKLDKKIKQQKNNLMKDKQDSNQINEIKNMIGYESVLMSLDQRSQMIKKYNEFMTNQVQQPPKGVQFKKQSKPKQSNAEKQRKTHKPQNEGEVFNQLKNKKQGKILNWANEETQQADDLFSNCSTSKKSKTRGLQLLKDINKEIQSQNKKIMQPLGRGSNVSSREQISMRRKKQRALQSIPEKISNGSRERLKERSCGRKGSMNFKNNLDLEPNKSEEMRRVVSRQAQASRTRTGRTNQQQKSSHQPPPPRIPTREGSKERVNKTATNSFKQKKPSGNFAQQRNRSNNHRSLSRQKQHVRSAKQLPVNSGDGYSRSIPTQIKRELPVPLVNKSTQPNKLSHLPPSYYRPIRTVEQLTVATQDQVFQIESFIKNELLTLNKQQRQLQQQLKCIHKDNKQKIKQIQVKYQIKTDYRHSHQLMDKQVGEQIEQDIQSNTNFYKDLHRKQTEDQLQESIQRLDDMLLRRQIFNKQRNSRITGHDNQSQSSFRSIINPMSDPITLHKQILQLAENLSRYEGQPQNIATGYGAKLRMKKKGLDEDKKSQQNRRQLSHVRNTQIDLSQSQDVNNSQVQKQSKVTKPPQLDYMNNYCMPSGHNVSDLLDDQLDDSIQKGKIQVNQRLKRMLLE